MLWTLAAASVGSLTALLIAFVAYPWQKRKDRESELMRERRAAYVEYTSAAKELIFAQPFAESAEVNLEYLTIGQKEQRFYAARDHVYLLAPQSVFNAMVAHEASLRNYVVVHSKYLRGEQMEKQPRDFAPEETELFQRLMEEFRKDVLSHAKALSGGIK